MTVSAALFALLPAQLVGLFTVDPAVIRIGVGLLLVAAVFQLFDGVQAVTTGALRGLGDTRTPMIVNLVGHWIIGLPLAYTLCFHYGWGAQGLWMGLAAGLIVTGLVLLAVWHRRRVRSGFSPPVPSERIGPCPHALAVSPSSLSP